MADIVDAATRSRMMRGIRGSNTKPEILVRSILHREGFRFRLHVRDLPGKPDIVLPRYKAVVLVHGCFWHGHDCSFFRLPGTRTEFWRAKITRNKDVDGRTLDALKKAGWRVALVWECALKGRARLDEKKLATSLARWLRSSSRTLALRGQKPTG